LFCRFVWTDSNNSNLATAQVFPGIPHTACLFRTTGCIGFGIKVDE
jgi:hypothetical protein